MSNRQHNYEYGYRQAMHGRPYKPELATYLGYDDGWDAGNCDRPTGDELQPVDVEKERSTGCLT